MEKEINQIIKKHNNSFHRAIKMTPNKTWSDPENETLKKQNGPESE
jgi:hypothetical protein